MDNRQAESRTSTESSSDPSNVVVVGAGPAGLAAACALAARGIPTKLMEKSQFVGGKVQSHSNGGFSLEHGVHGWWLNYINFDRLLEHANVNLASALKHSGASNLVRKDGSIHRLDNLPNIPSPLHMLWECLRAPFLTLNDFVLFIPFAIHLLAFDHRRDYMRYDGISFQELMDSLKVSQAIQRLILRPFILSFDFATPNHVSAAAGLSGCQFYVLHDRNSIFTRWSRGLPQVTIFGPICDYLGEEGGEILLKSAVDSIEVKEGQVSAVKYYPDLGATILPERVIGSIEVSKIPQEEYISIETQIGSAWITRDRESFRALDGRCTHQGCMVDWNKGEREFQCPCHGGRFDNTGEVIDGPPSHPLRNIPWRTEGDVLHLIEAVNLRSISCQDVIVATDVEAAKLILNASNGVSDQLKSEVSSLQSTPVIVVRLWFTEVKDFPENFESGITPEAQFIDNFFHLNDFAEVYNQEGTVFEVQSYRVDDWLAKTDANILDAVFSDLLIFLPCLSRDRLKRWNIQKHVGLFSLYTPKSEVFRPDQKSGVKGLHLAGDWTRIDWSVWMMERAIVSGLRAANAVLVGRGLAPIEILQLPREGLLLRWSRRIARKLRSAFWSDFPKRN